MTHLTVLVDIQANPQKVDLVRTQLSKLTNLNRVENGCIESILYQDTESPVHFISYETWESRELWEIHMNTPHMVAYVAATNGAVDSFSIKTLAKLT